LLEVCTNAKNLRISYFGGTIVTFPHKHSSSSLGVAGTSLNVSGSELCAFDRASAKAIIASLGTSLNVGKKLTAVAISYTASWPFAIASGDFSVGLPILVLANLTWHSFLARALAVE
jgi:hypothetical protein